MTLDEERTLILSIQEDRSKFALLFDMTYSKIFGYIMRRTGDYELAQDLSAETFLKAFLNINRFSWKNISVMAWLYRIATNETNAYYRRGKLIRSDHITILNPDAMNHPSPEDERITVEKEFQRHQQFVQVLKELKTLPYRYQEVIALRFFEQLPISEISNILDKPEGTVKSLISRGLEKLRKKLGKNATESKNLN